MQTASVLADADHRVAPASRGLRHIRLDLTTALIVVAAGPDAGRICRLSDAPMRVGRGHDCDLVLSDAGVASHALEVLWDGQAVRVRDLGTAHGAFYGEARVRDIAVGFGAEIRVATTRLRIQPAERLLTPAPCPQTRFESLVGRDTEMRRIFTLIGEAAPAEVPVLLEGERGTGKEQVARTLHLHSRRASGPYLVVDCGGLSPNRLDGLLFGSLSRAGAVERADGGTLVLVDVDHLGPSAQARLLAFVDTGRVARLGGAEAMRADVRVLSTLCRTAHPAHRGHELRDDLYYRLAALKIALPPLRDRLDDLPLLVEVLLADLGADFDQRRRIAGADLLRAMCLHPWTGNVRELRDRLQDLLRCGSEVDVGRLLGASEDGANAVPDPDDARGQAMSAVLDGGHRPRPFKEAKQALVASFEKVYLEDVLRRNRGNVSRASREAEMDRKHFMTLMRKYGLR